MLVFSRDVSPLSHQLRREISKCEALKLQNIQRFVDGMRQELHEWWDKCFYSEKQRKEFKYFNDSKLYALRNRLGLCSALVKDSNMDFTGSNGLDHQIKTRS